MKNDFEKAIRRRKELLATLGDVGRFLSFFFEDGEITEAGVKKTIIELEEYAAFCFDQIEEISEKWQKTDRQIIDLKVKMKDASLPVKKSLMAKAGVLLRRFDGFQGQIAKLRKN